MFYHMIHKYPQTCKHFMFAFGLTSFLLTAGVSFSRTCGPERSRCSMINWPARFNMMLSAMQACQTHRKGLNTYVYIFSQHVYANMLPAAGLSM